MRNIEIYQDLDKVISPGALGEFRRPVGEGKYQFLNGNKILIKGRVFGALTICIFLTIAFCKGYMSDDPLVVETRYGKVRGKQVGKANVWLGVPYASPPVGDLRWKPPVVPDPWKEIREAVKYPLSAAQPKPKRMKFNPSSEDCLYLNIFAPAHPASSGLLPIMVYFHGGSNAKSSPTWLTIGAEDLFVGQKNNVVLVTVQFRLGLFGFLGHPSLTKESEHESSGNYGFLDQIESLKWVQQNIGGFNGDPDRVTIFGSSGGSIDVASHVASPLSRRLFHRAIMQSWPPAAPTLERKHRQGQVFAEETGCADTPEVMACLRELPWEEVLEVQAKAATKPGGRAGFYQPIDGWGLLDSPYQVFQDGKHNHVPFVIGSQSHDTQGHARRFFPNLKTTEDLKQAVAKILSGMVQDQDLEDTKKKLLSLYPADNYKDNFWAFVDMYNDWTHIAPDRRVAASIAGSQAEPVYRYILDQPLSGFFSKYGSDHFHINMFVFQMIRIGRLAPWYPKKPKYEPTEGDLKVADYILDYWTSFAVDGHMGSASAPAWLKVTPERETVQIISETTRSVENHKEKQLAFWDDLVRSP